jgi:hypothetical protein
MPSAGAVQRTRHKTSRDDEKGRPRRAGLDLLAGLASHRRRQIGISVYLEDGDVGCCARGAPTSSRARDGASCSYRTNADSSPSHTGDRGASCATPSREVVPRRSTLGHAGAKPDVPGATKRQERLGFTVAGLDRSQRFGRGPRNVRGDVSPKAAVGGPVHARLALGNSAVPVLGMPRSDADGFPQNRPLPTRTGSLLERLVMCLPTAPPAASCRQVYSVR